MQRCEGNTLLSNFGQDEGNERNSEDLWYEICYRFYINQDSIGKDAIQWFQNHSPGHMASSHSSTSPLNQNYDEEILTSEKELLYRRCGIFQCPEDQWYVLEKIKNQARSHAHSEGTKKRLLEAVYDMQILQFNQQHISLTTTKQILNKFLDLLPTQPSLALLREIFIEWIQQQLQYQTCTILFLEASEFTERSSEITHIILSFLCSISNYQLHECFIPLTSNQSVTIQYRLADNIIPSEVKFRWIMKEDLSNSFLKSLLDLLTARQYRKYGTPMNYHSRKRSETIQSDVPRERIDEIDEVDGGFWRICLCCF